MVNTNRNTMLKYSDSFIPKRIVDLIIPIPIRFLMTPIRLSTREQRLEQLDPVLMGSRSQLTTIQALNRSCQLVTSITEASKDSAGGFI